MTTNTEFHAETGDWKQIPTKPPLTAPIPTGATQYQIAQANKMQEDSVKVYHSHQIANEAIKKLFTENIEEIYFDRIEVGSADVLDIITHLKDHYYKISSMELAKNDNQIREEWDVDTPIEKYFKKVKDCQQLAKDAKDEYTDKQILQIMFIQMQEIDFF